MNTFDHHMAQQGYSEQDLWVAADAQLQAEGVDPLDLHDPDRSGRICMDLIGYLLRMQANGTLELASRLIDDELKKLYDSELEAVAEELRAGMGE